jgi:hypothetical protein
MENQSWDSCKSSIKGSPGDVYLSCICPDVTKAGAYKTLCLIDGCGSNIVSSTLFNYAPIYYQDDERQGILDSFLKTDIKNGTACCSICKHYQKKSPGSITTFGHDLKIRRLFILSKSSKQIY